MPLRRMSLPILLPLALAASSAPDEKIVWKPLAEAVLRIDDRAPKLWNVYRAGKDDRRLLVQLGRRFLLLDSRAREIYELEPEKLERRGKELLWRATDKPSKPVPSSDWVVRDAGRVLRVRARLAAEGRILEVQLPHPPDVRSLY